MFADLSNEDLLQGLDDERQKFSKSDINMIEDMINELILRGVYPMETPNGNPNSVSAMVHGWGAYWHIWRNPNQTCPVCKADLRDHAVGPPFLRTIGISRNDEVTSWKCPDCHFEWTRS